MEGVARGTHVTGFRLPTCLDKLRRALQRTMFVGVVTYMMVLASLYSYSIGYKVPQVDLAIVLAMS